ncbi:4'-phosphopantetheinyl transferase family protein [Rhizobium laguerreae]|uniref:4'-phosphopantetheinyl transferase family protein n=1 Tax=Rhizobium laguerreae TaxID=1076926 RepID=UPI001C924200|nr:4'-phosphopantetheinyl transferase superfamily protein [Rhizobium laguerreae]MBY3203454.1 4'-phosphopantetheinyl transferase superfamily protein [Rhizobium laguerreae]
MTGGSDESDRVEVWYQATHDLLGYDVWSMLPALSEEERQHSERFQFAEDRRDYVAAHALLRRALSGLLGGRPQDWRFVSGPHGKPELVHDQAPYQVSLSHSRGFVACAITRAGPVGIDTEIVDPSVNVEQIAARFFSPRENELLATSTAEARHENFTALWTLKEAVVKALGTGLTIDLSTFTIELAGKGDLIFQPPPDQIGHPWNLALFTPIQSHCLAIAVRSGAILDYTVQIWNSQPHQRMIIPERTLVPA